MPCPTGRENEYTKEKINSKRNAPEKLTAHHLYVIIRPLNTPINIPLIRPANIWICPFLARSETLSLFNKTSVFLQYSNHTLKSFQRTYHQKIKNKPVADYWLVDR